MKRTILKRIKAYTKKIGNRLVKVKPHFRSHNIKLITYKQRPLINAPPYYPQLRDPEEEEIRRSQEKLANLMPIGKSPKQKLELENKALSMIKDTSDISGEPHFLDELAVKRNIQKNISSHKPNSIDAAELVKVPTKEKINQNAIDNFLGTTDKENVRYARANLYSDARVYGWNKKTVDKIEQGIKKIEDDIKRNTSSHRKPMVYLSEDDLDLINSTEIKSPGENHADRESELADRMRRKLKRIKDNA